MSSDLDVYLSGAHAGTVEHVSKGKFSVPRFRYTDAWIRKPGAYPLSLSLPLGGETFNDNRTARFLKSLLPENQNTLTDWQRRYRDMDRNDPTSILMHLGEDVAGAAKFVPRGSTPSSERPREKLTDDEVGGILLDLRSNQGAMPHTARLPKVSLAGQHAKVGLFYTDSEGWALPEGDLPSTHILKPAADELSDIDINEVSMMHAARSIGVNTARSEIREIGGQRVFVSTRYDRMWDENGTLQRIHQEDFTQAMGYASHAKYQKRRGPSLKEIAPFIRENSLHPDDDLDAFNQLLAFNVCIGNADAHAKNHSFIITPDGACLAPAYDLMSVAPYPAYDQELAFSIGKQYVPGNVTPEDWRQYAQKTGQDPDRVAAVVADTWDRTPDAVSDALQTNGASSSMRDSVLHAVGSAAARRPSSPQVFTPPIPSGSSRDDTGSGRVLVRAYTRADGTSVPEHYRSPPSR